MCLTSNSMVLSMWKFFALSLCLQLEQIQADWVPANFTEVTTTPMGDVVAHHKCGEGPQKGLYHCVSYHRCDPITNTTLPEDQETSLGVNTEYHYQIDIRVGKPRPCKKMMHVCCKIAEDQPPVPPIIGSTTPPSFMSTLPPFIPVPVKSQCGIRNKDGIGFQVQGNTHNEAEYGEFPWMIAVVKKDFVPAPNGSFSVCGGSLIAPRVVLTGAHCIQKYQASELKARAGEWDAKITDEQYPYQERNVAQIILHEKFRYKGLLNDIALLVLEIPFSSARHIGTICLPNQNEEIVAKECYATGWGKNAFGEEGEYQLILKKIDLPTVPHNQCQKTLQNTKLGNSFSLHNSFMCAGGVEGKDVCTGDGGSPLVCPDPKNPSRYVQAGIVAWGLNCNTKIPGVYANVAKFRNWVDAQMKKLNLPNVPYV